MSEWTTFTGRVVLRKNERFSVKSHLQRTLEPFSSELFYHEEVKNEGAIRVHDFRLSVLTNSNTVNQVTDALRSIPGTVGNLWIEGCLYL